MVLPAICAVKANANKNWQSQHLITLEGFVSKTFCKRIALVSLQTAPELLMDRLDQARTCPEPENNLVVNQPEQLFTNFRSF